MHEAKTINTPLGHQAKHLLKQALHSEEEKRKMKYIPSVSGVRIIMYGMVCNKSDATYVINVVSRFMANSCQEH